MKVKWRWEQIDAWHRRTKVAGGWIVEYYDLHLMGSTEISMCFVPDPDWTWEVGA
jgi:hypothetical protein